MTRKASTTKTKASEIKAHRLPAGTPSAGRGRPSSWWTSSGGRAQLGCEPQQRRSFWHFLLRGRGQREGGGAGGLEWNRCVDLERLWIWSSDGANLCGRGTNGTNQTEAPPPSTKPPFQNKNRKSESTSCHSSIVCFWQHGNFSRFSSRGFWFPWRTRVRSG